VKLDVVNGRVLASSVDLTLGTGAVDGRLLGVAGTKLTGNAAANVLEGNKGANIIKVWTATTRSRAGPVRTR
jgi:hypothetical protein